jgi:hypothetical protein
VLLAGCAGNRAPDNPDARSCLPAKTRELSSRDYQTRLAAHKARADAFAACMQARGYSIDQVALEERLRHFEQVKNAQPLGGDPWQAVQIRRQELRTSSDLWRRGS